MSNTFFPGSSRRPGCGLFFTDIQQVDIFPVDDPHDVQARRGRQRTTKMAFTDELQCYRSFIEERGLAIRHL